ncbi:hypothetical protein [Bacillus sp. FJAT-27245]|uniref:hypothetical protein n=1 Tax=Bacillus sp. FJAT-27245 TaxID=1684144 RepID=UPI0006A7870E|nr:hypothetical protein [Bacillus sp. FJAT-27245]
MEHSFRTFLDAYLDAWRASSIPKFENMLSLDYQAREITGGEIVDFGYDESIEGWRQGFDFALKNQAQWVITEHSVFPLRDNEHLVVLSASMLLGGVALDSGHLFFQTFRKFGDGNWRLARSYIEAGIPYEHLASFPIQE